VTGVQTCALPISVIAANVITFILVLVLLGLKIKYR
jgi:uncharacterized protein with PQ loop repeat